MPKATSTLPNKKLAGVVFYIEGAVCECTGPGLVAPCTVEKQGGLLAVRCRRCGATAYGHADTHIRMIEQSPGPEELRADLDDAFGLSRPLTGDEPS